MQIYKFVKIDKLKKIHCNGFQTMVFYCIHIVYSFQYVSIRYNMVFDIKKKCNAFLIIKGVQNFGTKKMIAIPGNSVPVLSVLDALALECFIRRNF
jgi:hypothetical protein